MVIVYFTRTGKSKEVAIKLAEKMDHPVYELKDNKNWKGLWGYIKAGSYAVRDKPVDILVSGQVKEADRLIVVAPLWAGGPAPAARQLIRQVGPDKVVLVMTNDGSNMDKAIKKTQTLITGIKAYYGITKKKHDQAQVIDQIAKEQGPN